MHKREASFQEVFNRWLMKVFLPSYDGEGSGFAFELKHTKGADSLPFSDVKQHQMNALQAAKNSGLAHKISDETRGFKPFDCFALRGAEAYIVIRYPSFFVLIDVDDFEEESFVSKRKSLTANRAQEIAAQVVPLPSGNRGRAST